jgi:phosphate ABC transporter phosphate-binding protein
MGLIGGAASRAQAAAGLPVSGAGSTWAATAVNQWSANLRQEGLSVGYAATGSADGRRQFANSTVDYAVSDVPYGLTDAGVTDPAPARSFTYLPLVAGGTALAYHLTVGGKPLTGLRLSGGVVAGIFTGTITSWDDWAIAVDNPGVALPARPIVPVVRSDGAGSTRQFTAWLAHEHPVAWDAYCSRAGRPTPSAATSTFPVVPGSTTVAQSGSVAVAGWVAQAAGEGSITYVEYAYALNAGLPAAKLLNSAGFYLAPTAPAVVAALQAATPLTDQTLDLTAVYANSDSRSYPLSGVSYLIAPTAVGDPTVTPGKGATLAEFTRYALCEGQQVADVLGYAQLPPALVTLAGAQRARITGTTATPGDLTACTDPAVARSGAALLATSPTPPSCDRLGATPCELTPAPGPSPSPSGGQAGSPTSNPPGPGCGKDETGRHLQGESRHDGCRSGDDDRCSSAAPTTPLVAPVPTTWTRTLRRLGWLLGPPTDSTGKHCHH